MAIARLTMSVILVGVLLICGNGELLWAGDGEIWPQWRGPNRDGSVSSGSWPDDFRGSRLTQRWRVKLPPSYSGPVVSTNRVFVTYTRDKQYEGVRTFDRQTGKEVWSERIGGNYSASPIYADGRLYFCSEEGKTTVLAPGRVFKKLAENKLTAGFMASPAVTGKALFLRTKTHLYRIEE